MLKSFLALREELTPHQKDRVDNWFQNTGSEAEAISKHVMPHDRVTVPLESLHDKQIEPHPEVKKFVESKGFKVKDYLNGMATDKYGRDRKIGKILNEHKAGHDLVNSFINDPRRATARAHPNLNVVISRHPYDVAGMSTDRGWTSCLDMHSGEHRDYLQADIEHGTHVAYLVHHGDFNAEHPVARIALRPYYSKGVHPVHTILRPEEKYYGTASDAFSHTVSKWASENFPMHHDSLLYHKNQEVYDDSATQSIPLYNGKALMHDRTKLDRLSAANQSLLLGQLHREKHYELLNNVADYLIKSPNSGVRRSVASFGSEEHRQKLINDPSDSVREAIALKGNEQHQLSIVNSTTNNHLLLTSLAESKHPAVVHAVIDKVTDAKMQRRVYSTIMMQKGTDAGIRSHIQRKGAAGKIAHAIWTKDPHELEGYTNDFDEDVRKAAYRNPNTPLTSRLEGLHESPTDAAIGLANEDLSHLVGAMPSREIEAVAEHNRHHPTLKAIVDTGHREARSRILNRGYFPDHFIRHGAPHELGLSLKQNQQFAPMIHNVLYDEKYRGATPNEIYRERMLHK